MCQDQKAKHGTWKEMHRLCCIHPPRFARLRQFDAAARGSQACAGIHRPAPVQRACAGVHRPAPGRRACAEFTGLRRGAQACTRSTCLRGVHRPAPGSTGLRVCRTLAQVCSGKRWQTLSNLRKPGEGSNVKAMTIVFRISKI